MQETSFIDPQERGTVLEKSSCQNLNRADTRTSAATHNLPSLSQDSGTQRARGRLLEPIKFEYANAVNCQQTDYSR